MISCVYNPFKHLIDILYLDYGILTKSILVWASGHNRFTMLTVLIKQVSPNTIGKRVMSSCPDERI